MHQRCCNGVHKWPQLLKLNFSNNQLDGNAVFALTQVAWLNLYKMCLNHNTLEVVGMQHLMSCS